MDIIGGNMHLSSFVRNFSKKLWIVIAKNLLGWHAVL